MAKKPEKKEDKKKGGKAPPFGKKGMDDKKDGKCPKCGKPMSMHKGGSCPK